MPPKFKPSHKEAVKGKDGRPTKKLIMRHNLVVIGLTA